MLTSRTDLPVGDYVSEGLTVVMPDACFPHMVIGDKDSHPWPYLRREIPHNWYCDQRAPVVGFLNRDEATLLYNLALQFRGKPALEIGSWMGWSTCHLALAGVVLDVIDPVLADPEHARSVRESLRAAGVLDQLRLYATSSPDGVRELAQLTGVQWNFFFIDGNHETPAPAHDALECLQHAAPDAMVVFHDLTAPDVEEGLQVLWRQGWQVRIYQTMQIMGIAWRGKAQPVPHTPDPLVPWSLPLHLVKYPVSGVPPAAEIQRLAHNMALGEQEIERLQAQLATVRAESEELRATCAEQATALQTLQAEQATALQTLQAEQATALQTLQAELVSQEGKVHNLLAQTQAQRGELDRLRPQATELSRLRSAFRLREAEWATREEELARLTEHMQHQEVELRSLRPQAVALSHLQVTCTLHEAELAARADHLAALTSQLQAQDAELALGRAAMAERDHLGTLLTARETDLARTQETVNERAAACQALTLEARRSMAESRRLAAEIDHLQHALSVVHHSTSWKMTRPLRVLPRASRIVRQASRLLGQALSRDANALLPGTPWPLRFGGAAVRLVPHLPRRALRFYRTRVAADSSTQETVDILAKSGLFDPDFYLASYPDVRESGMDPLTHYIQYGVAEGRDPHPLFATSFYCEHNPDVLQTGINPLLHYVLHGVAEGRDPHPLFATAFYGESYPDVLQTGMNPVVHYLLHGAMEGRNPHPLFDTSFYYDRNPDVRQAGVNPLVHYVRYGAAEGRDPHPLFDTAFYCAQKPYVREHGLNPLVHFLAEGPTADFDPLSPTPPLAETGVCIVTPDIVGPVKNGGIGTACYHFARTLAQAGEAVSILFTGDVTDCQKAHWRNTYAKMGIKFIALSDTPPVTHFVYGATWFAERSWRVLEYLRQARFSVVHFQDWQANGFWTIKAKQMGLAFAQTTLTVMTHSCTKWINEGMQQFSAEPFETAKLIWAETYCMEHCDILLSPSRHMLQWVQEHQITPPPKTLLTPYTWTTTHTQRPRPVSHVDNDHLIFFGRLETRKGLHLLGDALRQLQREDKALPREVSFLGKHAVVQGEPSAAYLEALQRDLPTVLFHVINDFDHLQAMTYIQQIQGLVVMPSLLDNYPLTVLECIQNSVPFIASTTGGIPEMIDDRVAFAPNAAALAATLATRHTIPHPQLAHKYSASLAATVWRHLHTQLLAPSHPVPQVSQGHHLQPVSVCIPFFNHERYLEALVTAFAHQSYPAFEVILVNDGSAPAATQVFEQVARNTRDARFRFLSTENRGPGAARNYAAEQARHPFLLFFDADNIPKGPYFIETLVRAIQTAGADCVTCPYDIVSAEKVLVAAPDVVATYRPMGACLEAGFFENTLGDATMIIARPVFRQLEGFPLHRASWEDHEFLLRLCFKGYKLETFPDALFYYRQSPTGRNQQANAFRNYQNLFAQLQEATPKDLAQILTAVGAPMLLGRPGSPAAHLIAS